VTLATLADDILRLLEIRIVAIWTWGYKIAAERVTPQRVRKRGEILVELRRLVTDSTLTDTAFRLEASALLLPEQSGPAPSRAADVREVLTRNARRIRPLLELLVKLDIRGVGPGYEASLGSRIPTKTGWIHSGSPRPRRGRDAGRRWLRISMLGARCAPSRLPRLARFGKGFVTAPCTRPMQRSSPIPPTT
jgi:hypothetical protein